MTDVESMRDLSDLVEAWQGRATAAESRLEAAEAKASKFSQLFNRLDAAVARHRTRAEGEGERLWVNDWDEDLWAAHDRILKAGTKRD